MRRGFSLALDELPRSRAATPKSPCTGLKTCQRVGFVVLDIEQLIQLRDCEYLVDFWTDVAELQFSAMRFDALFQRDQLAQCGAREKLDGRKVEQQAFAVLVLDQLKQFLAQLLDIGFVQNLAV